jgi:deoxyadenosine/deoxycytidine kinase
VKQGLRIAVEGNIGVGKSTLLPRLQQILSATNKYEHPWTVLSERVDEDPEFKRLLEAFYQDSNKQVQLQSWITQRRLEEYRALRGNPGNYLFERSFLGEVVFCHANLLRHEKPEGDYIRFFYDVTAALRECQYDAVIYLKASPETCFSRIRFRSRAAESNIPHEYIQYLYNCYETHLPEAARVHNIPVVTIDWNQFGSAEQVAEQLETALDFYGQSKLPQLKAAG